MHEITEKFINALQKLEQNRDVEQIAALFAEDAEINNVVTIENNHDLDAHKFWTNYRDSFGEVNSEFINKILDENSAALEWKTTGTDVAGSEIEYEGVSILESNGEHITRFFAYFDAGKLGTQMKEEKAQKREA